MAVVADDLESGRDAAAQVLSDVVELMRSFACRGHHGSEEAHFFPMLVKRGVPTRGCPPGILIQEHKTGRARVVELARSVEAFSQGEAAAKGSIVRNLPGLGGLYPSHM